ncbi:MAG: FAD synthase [Parcubacteria group bacterium GW2011_GWA2_38_13]|nr:MAG: FAD synthase [Parcubacteria group bacterium GW2011_GWA2_38_13]
MKIVMVFGTFDILHPGHLNFFKQAKEHGDYLIIVVGRDSTIKEVKGEYPLHNEEQRLENIINLKITGTAVLGSVGDKYKVIRKFNPDCICLGYDQKFFIEKLQETFPKIKIVRLKAYKPNIYKSSLLKKIR